MGPKKDEGAPSHLAFRASPEMTARIERLAEAMSEKLGGVEISKTAVLKMLVEKSLPALELEYTPEVLNEYTPEETKGMLKVIATEAERQKFLADQLRKRARELHELKALHQEASRERDKDE
jgi:hypothetical protein